MKSAQDHFIGQIYGIDLIVDHIGLLVEQHLLLFIEDQILIQVADRCDWVSGYIWGLINEISATSNLLYCSVESKQQFLLSGTDDVSVSPRPSVSANWQLPRDIEIVNAGGEQI